MSSTNNMSDRILKTADAIREATDQVMAKDPSVYVIGLGVPQGAGGTTNGLKQKYPDRILDTPTSEAALTGLAVGSAIAGLHPIVHHDRVEFSLLAADQIFTQAAKWNYMFGGGGPVPIIFRIVIGRQWGNGPQHSQALYSLFGSVPGLKVVVPSSPAMAKGLLIAAARDKNPVVMLESRWLYGIKEEVSEAMYQVPLDKAQVVQQGSDITVVGYGDALYTARQALELLGEHKKRVELIDLVSINPIDHATIHASVQKTGRLLTVDTTNGAFSVGSEVISKAAQSRVGFVDAPRGLAAPDVPCPTPPSLSEFWYPTKVTIANAILEMLGLPRIDLQLPFEELHLPPTTTL
ncbi:alpha-ketoacid dehydrogenase subunit beta [Candidatus Kaiserbacteria bacterium]|nr:alpha-ketoacid dehydrogenase subunit beta [Candidatus Kaiserbacteria bacterium]